MYDNVVLIPYRKREKHLEHFIAHTVPLLQKHLPNSKVVVIEQGNTELFNRGKILNVGFKEYQNEAKYFITHDVDINPTEKTIYEYYLPDISDNIVKGILTSPSNTLGGIIKISSKNVHKINGFPNDIWGWGAEDKALQNRIDFYNVRKETNLLHKTKIRDDEYFKTFDDVKDRQFTNHPKNKKIHYIQFRNFDLKKKEKLILESGLNNIEYTIQERKNISDYVELIKVDI